MLYIFNKYTIPSKKSTKQGKPLFKCSNCSQRATKNQAKSSKGICNHCNHKLRSYSQWNTNQNT